MSGRFGYVRYDDQAATSKRVFKERFEEIEQLVANLGPGRAQSLVMMKLEEAYMWVGKAIRDEQIARGGDATDKRPPATAG